jgi:hypothetical protein
MVSRPLESPRESANEPFYKCLVSIYMFQVYSRSYGPEIGDVNEGVVEGSEYAGNAEDEFTWRSQLVFI